MDAETARQFLSSNRRAVLATTRSDGRPQLSPVTVAVDGEGRPIISSVGATAKVHNLRRTPFASLCVMNDAFYGDWVQVEGPVEIVGQPEALDLLEDYYRRAAGEHPDWAEYREAMIRDERVLIRISIERTAGTVSG